LDTGDLAVTAGGAITQSGGSALLVSGQTALSAGTVGVPANITLGNAGNDFTGSVSVTVGNDVT